MIKEIENIQIMLNGLYEGGDVTEAARSSIQFAINEAKSKAINYSRCCETLKEEYIPDFSNWLKNNKYTHYCDNYYISEDNNVWTVNALAEKYVKETNL